MVMVVGKEEKRARTVGARDVVPPPQLYAFLMHAQAMST